MAGHFAPFTALAERLLPLSSPAGNDGSHDEGHILRVWRNAAAIQAGEGGDPRLIAAAVLLHDCVSVEKTSPQRAQASKLAAERAETILLAEGWSAADRAAVAHAVHAHSFSARVPIESLEAAIVQDADRLDAIGLIGVARCFYVAGRTGGGLFHPLDPMAEHRPLDDHAFALDHFETKLLRLADTFQTATGRAMAQRRTEALRQFRDAILSEI
ncbi:phosphohydrolase [Rhizobium rhizosphaerae]|uniref:Phosphohydrolase n=1 Tax=Xaviernesmea rhizosphaerae TaxID=1672749 RepID=A0A1Q9AKZ4_9HYPH|nr:HD domain-containing protein [Xaviernesmea rhizosphaerae]OLP56003.1 phosphohydrolase [Xaviernesmea rhizosphaerae]